MVKVKLIEKTKNKNGNIKREVKSEKEIKKNKSYKNFMSELSNSFSIPKNKFILFHAAISGMSYSQNILEKYIFYLHHSTLVFFVQVLFLKIGQKLILRRGNICKIYCILIALTEEEDENPINGQDDLDSYIEEAKEFLIIMEEGSIKTKPDKKTKEKKKTRTIVILRMMMTKMIMIVIKMEMIKRKMKREKKEEKRII